MQNRVGSHNPAVAAVTKLVEQVERVATESSPFTVSLTKEERRATLKMHSGGEYIVKRIAALVEKYGITLPNVSIEDMLNDLELAERLQPLQAAAADYAESITDTILLARSECWSAMTTFYTTLSRLADNDPKVAKDLQPVVEFFAKGPRQPAPTPAPSPAPAPTPTNGSNGATGAPAS